MDNNDNDLVVEKSIRFHRSIFAISATIGILLLLALLGSLLIVATGTHPVNPGVLAISEILFLLIPTILIYKPLKYKFGELFRFPKINFRLLLLISLGLIIIELINEGYLSIQKYLISADYLKTYESMLKEYIRTFSSFAGDGSLIMLFQAVFTMAFVPAISEEFLFRGFLQTTLEKNSRIIFAIAFTSVLFGLIHLEPIVFVPLTIAGAYFGFIGYITKSLWYPIILHFLNNLISIIIYSYQDKLFSLNLTDTLPIHFGILLFAAGIYGLVVWCMYLYKRTKDATTDLLTEQTNVA